MIRLDGCALLTPVEVDVVVRALRYAVATADRAAVRDGGARPLFAGPASELMLSMSDIGRSDVRGSVDEAVSGDAVHLMTTSEVARMTGLSQRQAQRRCAASVSARRTAGGMLLVDAAEVEEWVA